MTVACLIFVCYSLGNCMNVDCQWPEKFKDATQCNETLPYIHAELVNGGLTVTKLYCKKEEKLNVQSKR